MLHETPEHFFGTTVVELEGRLQLEPVTAEAKDMRGRMWSTFKTEDPETRDWTLTVTERVGFWGDEYDLLHNNCCYFCDHLLKILLRDKDETGKPLLGHCKGLPHWIFSLAKIGSSLDHVGQAMQKFAFHVPCGRS